MNDNKKRYVLFSKDDGRSDSEKPCAFFASPAGCKNGNNCKFLHGIKQNIVPSDNNFNQSLNTSNTLSLSYNSNDNSSVIDNSNNTNKRIKSKDKKNRNTDNQYDHKTTTVDSSSSSSFPTYANNNNSNNYNNHASSQLLQSHQTTTTAATSVVSSNSNDLIIQQLRDQLAQQQQLLNTHVLTNNNNVNNQAFNHNQAVSNNTYNHNQVTTHTPGSGVDTNHLQTITKQSSSSSSTTQKKQEKKRKSSDGNEFNDNSSPLNTSNKKKSSNDTSSSASVSTNNHMDLPYHSNPYSSIIASTQLIAGNSTSTSNQYHHLQQQQQPSIASITNYETNDDYDDDEDEDNNQFFLSVVNHVLDNSAQKAPLQQTQYQQQQQQQQQLLLQQQPLQQQHQQKQQQQPQQPQQQYVMSHLPPPVSNQHQIIAPTGMEIKQSQPLIQTNNTYTALPTTAASSSIVATNPFINSQDALKALQSSGSTHALYGVSKKNIFATPKISTNNNSSTSNSMNNNSSSISNDVKIPKNIFNPALVNFHELPWMKLVEQTKLNYRYPNNYTYIEDSSWVKAKIHGTWCINNNNIKNVISLDCEMCETTDPVTNTKYDNTLIRISVFDIDHKVLIDSLVQPGLPITETRTNIHGITEKQLVLAPWTLRQAQAALLNICSDQTIIIGHSIHKDLKSLKFNHKNVIDTAYLYTVDNEPGAAPSLRDISEQILGIKLPETHNSIQDAQAALYAAATLLADGPQPSISRKSSSSSLTKEFSLLIHRVPDYCNEEQLHHMIIDYTYIVPIKVNTIIRGDSGSSSGSNGNDNKNNNDYQKKGDIPSGKTMITFSTQQHRDLAFESIVGPNRPDKQNRPQKRIYFKGGGYICIRR